MITRKNYSDSCFNFIYRYCFVDHHCYFVDHQIDYCYYYLGCLQMIVVVVVHQMQLRMKLQLGNI